MIGRMCTIKTKGSIHQPLISGGGELNRNLDSSTFWGHCSAGRQFMLAGATSTFAYFEKLG